MIRAVDVEHLTFLNVAQSENTVTETHNPYAPLSTGNWFLRRSCLQTCLNNYKREVGKNAETHGDGGL